MIWSVDRPGSSSESTNTYEGPQIPGAGPATLLINFTADTAGRGAVVATSGLSVIVGPDGTFKLSDGSPMGSIGFASQLQGLSVGLQSQLYTGQSQNLMVSGIVSGGFGVVAIPTADLTYEIESGSENASLSGTTVTGLKTGNVRVKVSTGGLSSVLDFSVRPAVATRRILPITVNTLVVNPASGKLYGLFGPENANPNSLAEVNPITGAVSNIVTLGSSPDKIAFSADGTKAWVGLRNIRSVRSINLSDLSLGPLILLRSGPGGLTGDDGYAQHIAVNPNNPNEISVCAGSTVSSAGWGPVIIRNNVTLQNFTGPYTGNYSAYTSSGQLVSVASDIGGRHYRFDINDMGTVYNEERNSEARGRSWVVKGDQGFFNTGEIVSLSSLNRVGSLVPDNAGKVVAVDPILNRAWVYVENFDGSSRSSGLLHCVDLGSFGIVASSTILLALGGEDVREIHRVGSKGLVMVTDRYTYMIDNAPGL